MRHYVCGFLFGESASQRYIALIKKQRPKWQRGLYNGIGGKVEVGETPIQAMIREFREETRVTIVEWQPFCTIVHAEVASKSMPSGPWTVYFFKCFRLTVATLQSPTDEQVQWWHVNAVTCDLNDYFVPNLRWLISMALEDVTAEVQQPNWPHEQ